MAHNLNFNDQTNQHSFFSVKEKAWHGLGQVVEQYPTSAQAIQFAGLDYFVEKRPLFTNGISNDLAELTAGIEPAKISVPAFFATVRNDNDAVLGVVGKDYKVVQNAEAFTFLMPSWVVVMVFYTRLPGRWVMVNAFLLPLNCRVISKLASRI